MISLEKVLGAAIKNEKALSTLREAVTDNLVVANTHYRTIMKWGVDFYDQYGSLPTEQDAHTWFLTFPEERQKQLKSAWNELWNQELEGYTLSFLADTALEELRNIASRNASRKLASMGDEVDPEAFQTFSERINNIRPVELSGIADLSDISTWAQPRDKDNETRWPSGIKKLDDRIRGFGNELVFVVAESGLGKTTAMMNFGRAAMLEGATILHLSLELDLYATTQRYYRRIAEASQKEFHSDLEGVHKKLQRWFRMASGKIYTKYMEAYSHTVDDIKTFVDIFTDRHGKIDILILDYLDLVKRTTAQSRLPRDEQERRLSHEIRTICTNNEAAVISAAQATRDSYGKSNLNLAKISGGIAKAQAADIVLGLTQSDDEAQVDQGRLRVLKVRENRGKGKEIPLYMCMDKMFISDLDDPDARRIRQELRSDSKNKRMNSYG